MKKIFQAPMVVCMVFFVFAMSHAATYDATGTWIGTMCGQSNDCDPESPFEPPLITATVNQIADNNVHVLIDGRDYTGIVSGAVYTVSASWLEEGGTTTDTFTFTLTSSTSTSGSGHWDWVYTPNQSWNCSGDYTFILYKQGVSATENATGTWDYTLSNQSNTCGDLPEPSTGTAVVNQNGSTVTVTVDGQDYTGSASGAAYTVSATYPDESGTTRESMTFTLGSSTSGSGKVCWIYTETGYQCRGSYNISLTKQTTQEEFPWEIFYPGFIKKRP